MKEFIEKQTDIVKEKIKVTSFEIIVTGTKDKPYFEIKYKEVGKEDYNIGYSSYDLINVLDWKEKCFEIVLVEEYTPKTNDAWKIVYDKVCNLEKKYATKGNMASVNDCIRLENLLQYFKEELHCSEEHEHFRAMTNADKIKAMNNAELAEFLSSIHGEELQEKCPNYKSGCWYECTIEHACEDAFNKTLYLNWLQSEAE